MKERFELQLFAEEEQQEEQTEEQEGSTEESGETSEAMTREEVQKIIQSESDKIRQEVHKQYKDKLKEKDKEVEEVKKQAMTAEEKAQYEEEQRKKELQQKEQELTQKELHIKSFEVMREKEIPQEFQPFIVSGVGDEESLNQQADALSKLLKERENAVKEEILKQFGRQPNTGTQDKDPASMSMEEYEAWWNKQNRKR